MNAVILLALLGPCAGGDEEFPSLGFYLFPQAASTKVDRSAGPSDRDVQPYQNHRNEKQTKEAAKKDLRLAQYQELRQAWAEQEAMARKARIEQRRYYENYAAAANAAARWQMIMMTYQRLLTPYYPVRRYY